VRIEDGTITAFLEASATAVGAGMVLGGFAAGLLSVVVSRSRDELERRVLKAGYFLAAFCLGVRWAEIAGTI
jgi:hypothetical protein